MEREGWHMMVLDQPQTRIELWFLNKQKKDVLPVFYVRFPTHTLYWCSSRCAGAVEELVLICLVFFTTCDVVLHFTSFSIFGGKVRTIFLVFLVFM